MKIIANQNQKINAKTAVALGNFDGIHLGHQKLINSMISMSKERQLVPSVFTFDYNFNNFKLKSKYNTIISTNQKENLLENLGVETLYKVSFNEEFMSMSPEDFIKNIIVDRLNAKLVVIGFNFRFGYKAEGDTEYLKKLSDKYNLEVEVISPVIKNKCIISSTVIRNLIKQGSIIEANDMLGRAYTIRGTVVKGKGRGKKLGFATANLECQTDYIAPKYGVYKTNTILNGKNYLSITNVGSNPTFRDVKFSIETHIIDLDQNIYSEDIEVEFLEFIREEKKFENVQQLIKQVNLDINKVKFCE